MIGEASERRILWGLIRKVINVCSTYGWDTLALEELRKNIEKCDLLMIGLGPMLFPLANLLHDIGALL